MNVTSISELHRYLKDYDQIIMYGASENSHWLYLWLKDNLDLSQINIRVAVTSPSSNSSFHGEKVYAIDELLSLRESAVVLIATYTGYFDEIETLLYDRGFKNIVPISDCIIDSVYRSEWVKPIEKTKILVENFHGLGFGDSPRYVVEELLKRSDNLDIVWVINSDEKNIFPDGVRTVEMYSKAFFFETATAHIWISNVRKFHAVRKREGQFYIQTWHGFPLKTIEKDAEETAIGETNAYFDAGKNDSRMLDVLISNSGILTDIYRRCFWFDGPIEMTGFPRNDVFFRDNSTIRRKVLQEYGLSDRAKMVLYAPTFRKNYSKDPYDLNLQRIVESFQKDGTPWVILVRFHPNIRYKASEIDFSTDIINATEYSDMAELLVACDVLITDYSSSMFDYMYTGRPVFLYANDIEEYMARDRGFNIPYTELPFIISENESDLIRSISDYDAGRYQERLKRFINENAFMDDGKASERVADIVMEKVGQE